MTKWRGTIAGAVLALALGGLAPPGTAQKFDTDATRLAAPPVQGAPAGGQGAPASENAPAAPKSSAPAAFAAPAATPSAGGGSTQQQLDELRKQIDELNVHLRQLEVQAENDKKAAEDTAKKQPVVTANSKDGFAIQSGDKTLQLRVGALIGFDIATWGHDSSQLKNAVGAEQDGTGFSFARVKLSGRLYQNISFMAEYDFAGENGTDNGKFKEVYVQLDDIPWGGDRTFSFRAGHFKEPFSFEEMQSTPDRVFQERSLMNVLIPSYNAGVQISTALFGEPKKERATFTIGAFKETDDWPSSNDSDEDQGWQITARATGVPYTNEEGTHLLHVGVGYSYRNPDGAVVPWAERSESRLVVFRYVNVNGFAPFRLQDARADTIKLLNGELAGVWDRFSFQAEYTHAFVDTTFGGKEDFSGYYGQAGFFLTPDHRPYRNNAGKFDKVIPVKNFGWKSGDGWGAWEIAARYSNINLNSGPVRGGKQDGFTLGLNWFLNPNARWSLNYLYNNIDHDLYRGSFSGLQTRFQFDF